MRTRFEMKTKKCLQKTTWTHLMNNLLARQKCQGRGAKAEARMARSREHIKDTSNYY